MRIEVAATILGMALITYATRAGGLWLMGRVQPTPRLERWLRSLPGAILVALVAPPPSPPDQPKHSPPPSPP